MNIQWFLCLSFYYVICHVHVDHIEKWLEPNMLSTINKIVIIIIIIIDLIVIFD